MTTLMSDLVADTRRMVYGSMADQLNFLASEAAEGATSLEFVMDITTDFGSFTELVEDGVNGFKCHTFAEFVQAAIDVKSLDRRQISEAAYERFSLEKTAPKYEKYFNRLLTLWGDGWYQL